jgi:hypothetical protein
MNFNTDLLSSLGLAEGFFNSTIPLFLSYAEIHYAFKFLKPKYYLKLPEIIADIPIRTGKQLPVFIIIKDSHLFPIELTEFEVSVIHNDGQLKQIFKINTLINKKYYSQTSEFDLNEINPEQNLKVSVRMKIQKNGKSYEFINDNFPGINLKYFNCYYSQNPLPLPENWFAGEPHYHSNYTDDQVEFGADITSAKRAGKALGLSWLFVTDHSYDLDDEENNYTKNDPMLPKWHKMKADAKTNDEADFRVIHGEEVSIGNSTGKNVHMLAINHEDFIEGAGDSAEKWFRNKPTRKLVENPNFNSQISNPESLFIAAHPAEEVPVMQKLTLRRGNWEEIDYEESGIKFLQIINSADKVSVFKSIEYWKKLLVKGHKFWILAGNDAHGNFGVMRQIKSPFTKLFSSPHQVFGKFFTAFKYSENSPIEGIKNGEVIVSNGPFISFCLKAKGKEYPIGSVINAEIAEIFAVTRTAPEFGKISETILFAGKGSREYELDFISGESLDLAGYSYLRMSLKTEKGGLAFTNPVYISTI